MSGNVIPLTGDKAGPEDVGKYSGRWCNDLLESF